jgi:hypothetical protein
MTVLRPPSRVSWSASSSRSPLRIASLKVNLDSSLSLRCQRLQYLFRVDARLRNELLRRRSDLSRNLSLDHFRLERLDDVLEDLGCFLNHCWI